MLKQKIVIIILLIMVGSFFSAFLIRCFYSEKALFIDKKPLTRVLFIDVKTKSNKDFPMFLPKNSGFLIIHPAQSLVNHREDIFETNQILDLVKKTNKNIVQKNESLYSIFEIVFLKHTLTNIRGTYIGLADLGVKSIVFYRSYLTHFSELYQDKLPHVAGYIIMVDGSQRLIHDTLVK